MVENHSGLTWKFDRTETPWLRRLSYLVFGAFGGLLVLGLLARIRYLQQGKYLQFLVLVVALIIGPVIILGGVRYFGRRTETSSSVVEESSSNLDWSLITVVAVIEGTVVYVATSFGGLVALFAVVLLLGLAFGGVLALNVFSTEGVFNTETETLRVADLDSTVDLAEVQNVRTLSVGPIAFVWLEYVSSSYGFVDPDTRRLVTVSPEIADRLESVYEHERSQ